MSETRGGQCCAEMEIANGVAYCIRESGHTGSHRAEITFDAVLSPSPPSSQEPVGYAAIIDYNGTLAFMHLWVESEEAARKLVEGRGDCTVHPVGPPIGESNGD